MFNHHPIPFTERGHPLPLPYKQPPPFKHGLIIHYSNSNPYSNSSFRHPNCPDHPSPAPMTLPLHPSPSPSLFSSPNLSPLPLNMV